MYPTNPQRDIRNRKGNELFSGTASRVEFFGSKDARKASSELTSYTSLLAPNALRYFRVKGEGD